MFIVSVPVAHVKDIKHDFETCCDIQSYKVKKDKNVGLAAKQ